MSGEYSEVVPKRRLAYTWAWESTPDRVSLVTVDLSPANGGTELVLTHHRFFDGAARDRHQQGWTRVLDRFERYVSA